MTLQDLRNSAAAVWHVEYYFLQLPSGFLQPGDTYLAPSILGATYAYPLDYGLHNCSTHDALLPPSCAATNAGAFDPLANPSWCSNSWCYVNPLDRHATWRRARARTLV